MVNYLVRVDPSIICHLPFCNTLSPVMNFTSSFVMTFLLDAQRIISEFSLEIQASLALCKAIRLSVRTLLVSEGVKAWGLSLNIEGSYRFWPNTNWNGENPWILAKALFAFKHHNKGISQSSCWSTRILSSTFAIIMFRVRISGSHFIKCESISSICEAFSQRNNKNAKLSISFLVSWNKIIQEK